jgi:hypothetical protein
VTCDQVKDGNKQITENKKPLKESAREGANTRCNGGIKLNPKLVNEIFMT